MTALIVVDFTATDTDKLGTYGALSAQTLATYGGEFLSKGPIESLHGDAEFTTKAVIQFADRESAVNWYNSEEYQKIIPTRNQGMNSQFHLVG
jgi:uncharacterized protein (DUF1330 family)